VDTTFQANTNPGGPPNIVTAVFPRLIASQEDLNTLLGSVGFKINPFGNFLITINGLFPIVDDEGLQDRFSPLVAVDYSF
jgi:hypothetical protein